MDYFTATHVNTGEVRRGKFEDLCDLDKRIWTLKKIETAYERKWNSVICQLDVLGYDDEGNVVPKLVTVYSAKDLVGINPAHIVG